MNQPPIPKNLSLSEKISAKRAGRLKWWQDSTRRLIMQCWAGKCSPRQAIKAQCMDCVGCDRSAIATCTAYACPLYEYRPFRD